ncbi:MAG: hypothetical protein OXM61_17375 [Candidatus Poribacteria bacterium]|nr:hypothetical protein [Candidatus Poribacteria bacterium]
MLIVHFPDTDKTIELSGRDVAVHLDNGSSVKRFEWVDGEETGIIRIHTVLAKVYEVESINKRNLNKLIELWKRHKEKPAAIYLDGEQAKLTNHVDKLEVFCCVHEV